MMMLGHIDLIDFKHYLNIKRVHDDFRYKNHLSTQLETIFLHKIKQSSVKFEFTCTLHFC